jgi:hypothetical protein
LARLSEGNRSFLDFHILPGIDRRIDASLNDPCLSRGEPLIDLREFCKITARVRAED